MCEHKQAVGWHSGIYQHFLPLVSDESNLGISQEIFFCFPFLAAARAPLERHHSKSSEIIHAERGKGYAMGNNLEIWSEGWHLSTFIGLWLITETPHIRQNAEYCAVGWP
jgi:hypothetical protein